MKDNVPLTNDNVVMVTGREIQSLKATCLTLL